MQRLPIILFIISLVLIITIGAIAVQNTRDMVKTEREISRTNRVFFELEEIISDYKDLFSASREFIITGDSSTLISFGEFDTSMDIKMKSLYAIITDSIVREDLKRLQYLLTQRVETFTKITIHLRQLEGFEAARQYFIEHIDQVLIKKDIPQVISKIKTREQQLLDDRTHIANAKTRTTNSIIILGTFVSVAAVLMGLYFTKKGRKEVDLLNYRLQQHNDKLLNFSHLTSHNLRSPVNNLSALFSFYKKSEEEADRQMLLQKIETVILHLSNFVHAQI